MSRLLPVILTLWAAPALAQLPVIVAVDVTRTTSWRFEVTIRHPDTGREHYADGWEVARPDGTRLGYRELLHPHTDEQPFTRSLSGVQIPSGVSEVTVRAHCNVDGWSRPTRVKLPR